MQTERLSDWETMALGLALAVVALASPLAAAALLVLSFLVATARGLLRPPRVEDAFGAIAVTAAAAMAGGPEWAIAGAFCVLAAVRLEATVRQARDARMVAVVHVAAVPLFFLLHRAGADPLAVAAAGCLALVALMDWSVRRLADWRLGVDSVSGGFIWAQLSVVLPLIVFPSFMSAVVAVGAAVAAQSLRWSAAPRFVQTAR